MAKQPNLSCEYCEGTGRSDRFSDGRCMCTYTCWTCKDTGQTMIQDSVPNMEPCIWCPRENAAAVPQPPPRPSAGPRIIDLVVADINARGEFGFKKYGTYLRPNDGRDTLMDAYQESLDMAKYLRKLIYERTGR